MMVEIYPIHHFAEKKNWIIYKKETFTWILLNWSKIERKLSKVDENSGEAEFSEAVVRDYFPLELLNLERGHSEANQLRRTLDICGQRGGSLEYIEGRVRDTRNTVRRANIRLIKV